MKALTPLLLVLPLTAVAAPPTFLPDFTDRLNSLPSLTLSESVKQGMLLPPSPQAREVAAWFAAPTARQSPRYVSKMPVIEPSTAVDPHMPILAPDPAVDHKLIIKAPDVASVR
jgi:hypothetical protein